jgi:hypothetical protein
MKKFIEFALIWYSQQMAIPFWIIGHIHLSLNVYQDIHEILASLGLNILVGVGFVIDYKKTEKNDKNKRYGWNYKRKRKLRSYAKSKMA